jgi:hypothetical protein
MVWWPFAPKPERVDTSEVTDLHSDAPPLYSTVDPLIIPNLAPLRPFDETQDMLGGRNFRIREPSTSGIYKRHAMTNMLVLDFG